MEAQFIMRSIRTTKGGLKTHRRPKLSEVKTGGFPCTLSSIINLRLCRAKKNVCNPLKFYIKLGGILASNTPEDLFQKCFRNP